MSDEAPLRIATAADAEAISALVLASAQHWIFPLCDVDGRAVLAASMGTEATRERLLAGHAYLVAETEGRIVGVAALRLPAHLYNLFVDDRFQRRGIARRLWSGLRAHPLLKDAWPAQITVNASRHSVGVYLRLGFEAQGEEQTRGGIPSTPMLWRAPQA
ncbi:GNAT family N-acetyltransferase [Lysobacter firmicutimachus]|uniref:GNAT family N-acetyltransferase n=1 Tax=Lysobacter firmicutimachus TaxID=1792846 RepID=A0ABU8D1R7_9GAMM